MSKKTYKGEYLNHIAFPLGGIGAGMICLEGTGALSNVSIRNKPDVFFEPSVFSAICLKGEQNIARVIEGPVPTRKIFGSPGTGNGGAHKSYGLPRLAGAGFSSHFPFATINFADDNMALDILLTGWSPFIPGDADNSSLPVVALEYKFVNNTDEAIEAVYSFNAKNFMDTGSHEAKVSAATNGFVFCEPGTEDEPWKQGEFWASVDSPEAVVNCAWFRGGWFDSLTMAWNEIARGEISACPPIVDGAPSPGASIYVPFTLGPGEDKTVRLMLSWYVPKTDVHFEWEQRKCSCGCDCTEEPDKSDGYYHQPWYAGAFDNIESVADYWRKNYDNLRDRSARFADAFFDTSLPNEVIEAIEANLSILKSPTVLRQKDGRLWCWEGCCDGSGCCAGSCTHVWNYAQALPHLFPDLERTLRETEFNEGQDSNGHQSFRVPLPITDATHGIQAAADGQLGGIIKVYREWRISGDTKWLEKMWPQVKSSLDYCIRTWDPDGEGVLKEPHHNTYDIEFWGADGMCSSIYHAALKAAVLMGSSLGEDVSKYSELLSKGSAYLDNELWSGEYYIQKAQWEGLHSGNPLEYQSLAFSGYSPEASAILAKEGPKYQYGSGCLSDGVIGYWMAQAAGLGTFGNTGHVKSHLASIHKYNLKRDLSTHANPQRPTFAMGKEGGLLLCSWPNGGKPSLPFVYSDEVWTGIEYQVAAHCIMMGLVDEGLEIVRTARERYDGNKRNPYNEYECGHWYARAMSSYSLLQAMTGVRYDAVEKTLYVNPQIKGDFRSFLCTATGYGTVGLRGGEVYIEVKEGKIEINNIVCE
ncbi:non-lysosomal glucosylceramidase [bacterium]|nr:non-lysosomal glucosylceramidase [bacterium]